MLHTKRRTLFMVLLQTEYTSEQPSHIRMAFAWILLTVHFNFTNFKNCSCNVIFRGVVGSFNYNVSGCLLTIYYWCVWWQVWGGCIVSVTAGSLFCCCLSYWYIWDIQIKLSRSVWLPVSWKLARMHVITYWMSSEHWSSNQT